MPLTVIAKCILSLRVVAMLYSGKQFIKQHVCFNIFDVFKLTFLYVTIIRQIPLSILTVVFTVLSFAVLIIFFLSWSGLHIGDIVATIKGTSIMDYHSI